MSHKEAVATGEGLPTTELNSKENSKKNGAVSQDEDVEVGDRFAVVAGHGAFEHRNGMPVGYFPTGGGPAWRADVTPNGAFDPDDE